MARKNVTLMNRTTFLSEPINALAISKIAGFALVCSAAIYLTQDQVYWQELFAPPLKPVAKEPAISIETITLAMTLRFFHNPEVVFLDVRPSQFYDYGHIERARNLPGETLTQLPERQLALWKEAPAVIIYCNGVLDCGAGFLAARELMKRGLDNVKIYAEGWPEWRSCRLPISMSEQMKLDVANAQL